MIVKKTGVDIFYVNPYLPGIEFFFIKNDQ